VNILDLEIEATLSEDLRDDNDIRGIVLQEKDELGGALGGRMLAGFAVLLINWPTGGRN
jgi:hypothetical protein